MKIKVGVHDFGWTAMVSYTKQANPLSPMSGEEIYVLDVVAQVSMESSKNLGNVQQLRPPHPNESGTYELISFTFDCITAISTIRLKIPKDLKSSEARQSVGKNLLEGIKRMNGDIPELDPVEHMKMSNEALVKDIGQMKKLESRYKSHPIRNRADFREIEQRYEHKMHLKEEYEQCRHEFKKAKSLLQLEELDRRKRVLRRLDYCDENDTIKPKGRVACELSSADELLLTEMIFTAAFSDLSSEMAAALLSCFVFEERTNAGKMQEELSGHLRNLQNHARKIAKVSVEAKLDIDEEKYVESFGPQMMDVVLKWCSGSSFHEIVKSTDVFEGSIIRCMRRLEELLSQMVDAARSFGDMNLVEKFEKSRVLLKRDIVFSASLYL